MECGKNYAVTTKAGQTMTGLLKLVGSEAIWLYHDEGIFVIWRTQISSMSPA